MRRLRETSRRRQVGQSAVLMSLLTMILIFIIAFTSNIGKLVTERIAMQNAADLAAYAGAATQAGIMNDLRADNQRIYDVIFNARRTLENTENAPIFGYQDATCPLCVFPSRFGPGCPVPMQNQAPERIMNLAKRTADTMSRAAGARFRGQFAAQMPYQAARETADRNFPGVTTVPLGGSSAVPRVQKTTVQISYRPWGTISFPFCPFNGSPTYSHFVRAVEADAWWHRQPGVQGEVMFAVGVSGTPQGRFFDGGYLGNAFGCNGAPGSRCRLTAYAAAQPIHGKLGTIPGGRFNDGMEPRFQWRGPSDRQVNVTPNIGTQRLVARSSTMRGAQPTRRNYKDYKVRYVGIFETEARFQSGGRLRDSVPEGRRMRH